MIGSPLNTAREGQRYLLHKVSGSSAMRARLASLGLTPGTELAIIHRNIKGSFIISIKEVRLALGRETACHLWVS